MYIIVYISTYIYFSLVRIFDRIPYTYIIYATHIDYKHQPSIYFHHISIISPLLHLGWTFGLLFASAFWEDVAFTWLLNGYLSIYLSTFLPTYLSIYPSICLSLSLYLYMDIPMIGEIFDRFCWGDIWFVFGEIYDFMVLGWPIIYSGSPAA